MPFKTCVTTQASGALIAVFGLMSFCTVSYSQTVPIDLNMQADSPAHLFTTVVRHSSHSPAAPMQTNSSALAVATSDTFEQFVGYPAEDQVFQQMPVINGNNVSYFRDFFSGGETFSSGANDGDILTATIAFGNNAPFVSSSLTFYSTFNGQQNCWVGGFPPVAFCDALDIDIIWFTNSQCGQTGDYTMTFSRNQNIFFTGRYHLTPTIPPDTLAFFIPRGTYSQGSYPSVQYGNFCWIPNPSNPRKKKTVLCSTISTPNPPQATVSQLGCLLTDYSAILTYHGLPTTPTQLNAWLKDNGGYDGGGLIYPAKIIQFAALGDLKLSFKRRPAGGDATFSGGDAVARSAICSKGPTAVKVKHNKGTRSHFVTGWGKDEAESTYRLKDPNGGGDDLLSSNLAPSFDYNNQYFGTRELQGEPVTFAFPGGFQITLHSPAELLLTDSAGLKTGIDPLTSTSFAQIPNAAYTDDSIDDPEDTSDSPVNIEAKVLDLSPATSGTYNVTVTGTGTGTYDLEFASFDPTFQMAHTAIFGIPTSPGAQQVFQFSVPIPAGSSFPLTGGFDGGGQRPKDVNHFLSYANPTSSRTNLPAGTASFTVLIFYDSRDISGTFSAILNGNAATSLFNPTPGSFEAVSVPLQPGRNVLELKIDGALSGRVATDTDRLVFNVP